MTREEFLERGRAALGGDPIAIMARALRCTPTRFNSPAPVVVALVELIEAAAAAGISRDEMPPRWQGCPSHERRGDLRARFVSLFAPRRPVAVLRDSIGLTPDTLNRRLLASPETRQAAELTALAELLEIIRAAGGVNAWPARWREHPGAHDGRAWQGRAVTVLGPAAGLRLAEAVELTPDYIGRAFRGERDSHGRRMRPSGSLCAVIELLETLEAEGIPRDRWPERWRRSKALRRNSAAVETAVTHAAK